MTTCPCFFKVTQCIWQFPLKCLTSSVFSAVFLDIEKFPVNPLLQIFFHFHEQLLALREFLCLLLFAGLHSHLFSSARHLYRKRHVCDSGYNAIFHLSWSSLGLGLHWKTCILTWFSLVTAERIKTCDSVRNIPCFSVWMFIGGHIQRRPMTCLYVKDYS